MYKTKVLIGFIFLNLACATKRSSNSSLSEEQKCNAQGVYEWVGGACRIKGTVAAYKAECESATNGRRWINEQCVEPHVISRKATDCAAKKDGSVWGKDPKTGTDACISPVQVQTIQQECTAKAGFAWNSALSRCLSPTEQRCLAGNNFPTTDGQCVSQAHKDCLAKVDGSVWMQERCISSGEQACAQLGALRIWNVAASQCTIKGFLQFCNEVENLAATIDAETTRYAAFHPTATADAVLQYRNQTAALYNDIAHTVSVLKDDGREKTCAGANAYLETKTGYDGLVDRGLVNLFPLANFTVITSLNLSSNKIVDLTPLAKLTNLTYLDLSRNLIQDVSPLAGMTALTSLQIGFNRITDISPLRALSALTTLSLSHAGLTSVDVLFTPDPGKGNYGLNKLTELDLSGNCGLAKFATLDQLRSLQSLLLFDTNIKLADIPDALKAPDPNNSTGYAILQIDDADTLCNDTP